MYNCTCCRECRPSCTLSLLLPELLVQSVVQSNYVIVSPVSHTDTELLCHLYLTLTVSYCVTLYLLVVFQLAVYLSASVMSAIVVFIVENVILVFTERPITTACLVIAPATRTNELRTSVMDTQVCNFVLQVPVM